MTSSFTQVAEGIWKISTPLGGVYVFSYLIDAGDGFVLYDTGLKSTATQIFQLFQTLGRPVDQLRAVFLSHSHHDHIGAVAEIAERTGARVMAHALAEPWLVDHQRQYQEFFGRFASEITLSPELHSAFFDNLGRPWVPDVRLEALPQEFDVPRPMRVLHTPGHSADCISLFLLEDRILICGDAFMGAGVGGGLPQYEKLEDYRVSLRVMQTLQPQLLLSGHFQPLSGEHLQAAFQQALRTTELIHQFLERSLARYPEGVSRRFLTQLVCARFGRALAPQSFITITAHLNQLVMEQKAHLDGQVWKPDKGRQPLVNIQFAQSGSR